MPGPCINTAHAFSHFIFINHPYQVRLAASFYRRGNGGLTAVHKLSDPEVGICIQEDLRPCEEGDLAKQPSTSRGPGTGLLLPNSRPRFPARIIQAHHILPWEPEGISPSWYYTACPLCPCCFTVSEGNPVWLCVVAATSSPGLGVATPVTNTLLTIASVPCRC